MIPLSLSLVAFVAFALALFVWGACVDRTLLSASSAPVSDAFDFSVGERNHKLGTPKNQGRLAAALVLLIDR